MIFTKNLRPKSTWIKSMYYAPEDEALVIITSHGRKYGYKASEEEWDEIVELDAEGHSVGHYVSENIIGSADRLDESLLKNFQFNPGGRAVKYAEPEPQPKVQNEVKNAYVFEVPMTLTVVATNLTEAAEQLSVGGLRVAQTYAFPCDTTRIQSEFFKGKLRHVPVSNS